MSHCFCVHIQPRNSRESEKWSCCWCGKLRTRQFIMGRVDGHGPGRRPASHAVPDPRIEQEACPQRPAPAA
jgi:hypothetical protein